MKETNFGQLYEYKTKIYYFIFYLEIKALRKIYVHSFALTLIQTSGGGGRGSRDSKFGIHSWGNIYTQFSIFKSLCWANLLENRREGKRELFYGWGLES